jgi:hypothetical protein
MRGQRREEGWRWVVKERIEEISERRRHRRQEGRQWREEMHTCLLVPRYHRHSRCLSLGQS